MEPPETQPADFSEPADFAEPAEPGDPAEPADFAETAEPESQEPFPAPALPEVAEEKEVGRRRRQGIEWLVLVAASLAVALLVRAFLIQAFYIPSESMVPTLHKDDRVLVNKLSYRLHEVYRGDIVVFRAPPEAATTRVKDLIKRVIGLPGETIEGRGGEIYIDGKPLDEPYLPADIRSREFPPEKVPPDSYWVLGDNRQDSRDSTFFKDIDGGDIVGRAFVRIWPLSDLGLL